MLELSMCRRSKYLQVTSYCLNMYTVVALDIVASGFA